MTNLVKKSICSFTLVMFVFSVLFSSAASIVYAEGTTGSYTIRDVDLSATAIAQPAYDEPVEMPIYTVKSTAPSEVKTDIYFDNYFIYKDNSGNKEKITTEDINNNHPIGIHRLKAYGDI